MHSVVPYQLCVCTASCENRRLVTSITRGEELRLLVERVDRAALADSLMDALVTTIDAYRTFTTEQRAAAHHAVELNIEMLAAWVLEGREPPEEMLAAIGASVRERAGEGVQLEDVLRAYRLAGRVAWSELAALAGPEEHEAVIEGAELSMRFIDHVSTVISRAYFEGAHLLTAEGERGARRLLEAVVAGNPLGPDEQVSAERMGFPILDAYRPFAACLAGAPVTAQAALAGRLRREGALAVTEGRRVVGLLHKPLAFHALGVGNTLLVVDRGETPRPELGIGRQEARATLDLAIRDGRRGSVSLDEYALELVLVQAPSAAARVGRRVLGLLLDKPELADTLVTLVENDFDRSATGRALHVHRNTLLYRLKTIEELTSLDLRRATDLALVVLASKARRMEGLVSAARFEGGG
jgi:hypothetical protein